jgi:hypothetical protein
MTAGVLGYNAETPQQVLVQLGGRKSSTSSIHWHWHSSHRIVRARPLSSRSRRSGQVDDDGGKRSANRYSTAWINKHEQNSVLLMIAYPQRIKVAAIETWEWTKGVIILVEERWYVVYVDG